MFKYYMINWFIKEAATVFDAMANPFHPHSGWEITKGEYEAWSTIILPFGTSVKKILQPPSQPLKLKDRRLE